MEFRNVFKEFGFSETEIMDRLNDTFNTIFYGGEGVAIYREIGEDMGFLTDTGNNDVRTEGQSYGMMMCVQLDKKAEFDRIWKWTRTYMFMDKGHHAGYFAWSCALNGDKNAWGPAPDGEEFFAAALIMASHRWGDGEGIFNYSAEAVRIMHAMLNNPFPMFDKETHYIKFIAECNYSDPSYHVPHFYELYADELKKVAAGGDFDPKDGREVIPSAMLLEDAQFYLKAAECSREYFVKACDPKTGMCAEYARYDGTPYPGDDLRWGRHDYFFSDAYRTAANMALDYSWSEAKGHKPCAAEKELTAAIRLFYADKEAFRNSDIYFDVYEKDGTIVPPTEESDFASSGKVLHPYGLIATLAQSYLATDSEEGRNGQGAAFVKRFWELMPRTGARRYYDNCLYLFAFMALSGNYRIY